METSESSRGKWFSIARWAAIAIVVWAVVVQVLAGAVIPPLLGFGVLFGAMVPFIGRRWSGIVAAVLGLASILGNIPSLVDELSHPESAQAFILTTAVTMAAVVLIVAGLAAHFGWTARPQPLLWGAAAVVLVATVVGLYSAAAVDSVAAADGDLIVTARSSQFSPDLLEASSGQVGVWIDNRDGVRHTFAVPELGVDFEVVGYKTTRFDFDAPAGTYTIMCGVPGHEGMTATLEVR